MSALNAVALGIGRAVLAALLLTALSAAWWGVGHLVWRAIPERWRSAQVFEVPQPRYGDYIPPGVSRKALALLLVLGGPIGWLRHPRIIQRNRKKLALKERGSA